MGATDIPWRNARWFFELMAVALRSTVADWVYGVNFRFACEFSNLGELLAFGRDLHTSFPPIFSFSLSATQCILTASDNTGGFSAFYEPCIEH